jgi:hypothetical protein
MRVAQIPGGVYALDDTALLKFSRYRKIGIGQSSIRFYQDYRNG